MAKAPTIPPLSKRIDATLREGRYAQALELAKQNALQHPGPDSQALLRHCYLATATYHVQRDATRDANSLLAEAEKLPFDAPEWWLRLAELRGDLGDHARALQLLVKVTDPAAKSKVMGRLADRAMREQGDAGKKFLPPEYHAQLDLFRKAFDEYEKSNDDAARETLNGIGLASPFLEWKLMLRGLLAWSVNDDVKANENWNRLTPERLPAKLVAPLRFTTDKSFASTLPPERVAVVNRQSETLGTGLGDAMRRLRKQLATEQMLPQALETARALLPELKKTAPQVVPRLANVFYWSIISGGEPQDMDRYSKIFGPHPDDPQNHRLQALVMETIGDLGQAHGFWTKYEAWIAKTPERWPGQQANYARAMILERMGNLAKDWLERDDGPPDDIIDFFDIMSGGLAGKKILKPKALSPTPAECFQKASELAPVWLAPALRLLHEYIGSEDKVKAKEAAEQLLVRFPKSLPVLEAAAKVYDQIEEIDKSRDCLKQALALNPLDRKLQQRVAIVALNHARRRAISGDFDDARTALTEAKQYADPTLTPALLALSFATEMKAGNADTAQPLAEELFKLPGMRVAGAYRLMVEMSRLKLQKKTFTAYSTTFTDGMKTMNVEELTALLNALDLYKQEPTPYYGMKSQEKKILDSFTRTVRAAATTEEMVKYGFMLHRYRMWKALHDLSYMGTSREASDLHFLFFRAEASLLRQRNPFVSWQLGQQYRHIWQELQESKDNRYAKLREMFELRRKETPELDEAMNPRYPWEW